MNEIVPTTSTLLPVPARADLAIRAATMSDLPFIDSLQKKQSKQVGFFPTKAIEGKIALGQIIVAWAARPCSSVAKEDTGGPPVVREERVGYLIGQDQYFKRDDVGVIYQINIVPEYRRSLVAAMLLKAQFERSAYGCKLYCCWCAQDIEANQFWESMGFVALAFRTGSARKGKRSERPTSNVERSTSNTAYCLPPTAYSSSRIHIFWQKRIRSGDETTAWWFPSQTSGGSIREDRIVLPIPPGTGWRDVMPVVLPGGEAGGDTVRNVRATGEKKAPKGTASPVSRQPSSLPKTPAMLWFGTPAAAKAVVPAGVEKPVKTKKPKAKNDPRLVAAARELRDRWLEQVNTGQANVALPVGKYEVCRAIGEERPAVAQIAA